MNEIITSQNMAAEVTQILDASNGCSSADFDVDGIVRDLITGHGRVPVGEINSDAFWAIVQRHDASLREGDQ